jgi:GTPase SAR1 family protein
MILCSWIPLPKFTNETFSTSDSFRSFIHFQVWDFPGNFDIHDTDPAMYKDCGAMVFVIDAQVQSIDAG